MLNSPEASAHRVLRCFADAVVLDDRLVEGVEQVRCPHYIRGGGRDFSDARTEDSVQHFELSQVRAESLQHCRQGHGLICKKTRLMKTTNIKKQTLEDASLSPSACSWGGRLLCSYYRVFALQHKAPFPACDLPIMTPSGSVARFSVILACLMNVVNYKIASGDF